MSKTGAIIISLIDLNAETYSAILNKLTSNGWSLNKDGGIFFMLDDTFDYEFKSINNLEEILFRIRKSINNGLAASIDLLWKDNETVIELLYISSNELIIKIIENIKTTKDKMTLDESFYLEKIALVLEDSNVINYEVTYN